MTWPALYAPFSGIDPQLVTSCATVLKGCDQTEGGLEVMDSQAASSDISQEQETPEQADPEDAQAGWGQGAGTAVQ